MLSKDVKQLIIQACIANGVPELSLEITFEWSTRMTCAAGKAMARSNRIKLSAPIFAAMTRQDQENTVVHEACHLIAFHKYRGFRISPHGSEWQHCMRVAGHVPTRCHTTDLGLRSRRSGTQEFACACPGRVHYLGAQRAARAATTSVFKCRICSCFLKKA